MNSPCAVGMWACATRTTCFSNRLRYAMRSAIVMSVRSWSAANTASSSPRAISPSSFCDTISHSAPAGASPASRARSTAASVWPGRRSTPPSRARSGRTCPGRTRSPGPAAGSASNRIVWARSEAEIPVVTPSFASTVTVKAVRKLSELVWCIGGRSRRSHSVSVSATQM